MDADDDKLVYIPVELVDILMFHMTEFRDNENEDVELICKIYNEAGEGTKDKIPISITF